jgi:hypothetical protein
VISLNRHNPGMGWNITESAEEFLKNTGELDPLRDTTLLTAVAAEWSRPVEDRVVLRFLPTSNVAG